MKKNFNNAISPLETNTEDLALINQFSLKELTAEDVFTFNVILCDNDIDRDLERFDNEALSGLSELFVGKTGIFDHSMKSSDQTARIFSCTLITDDSRKNSLNENYCYLKAKAYIPRTQKNEALIEEIGAGIKKEVSINCSVSEKVCSICGQNLKFSNCDHIKGKKYHTVTCHHVLKNPTDAYEWSFVAVPAQKNAGVIKSFSNKENKNLDNILKSLSDADGDITLSKNEADMLSSHINQIEVLAEAGKAFKESLRKEIMKYSCSVMPSLGADTIKSICENLDADTLQTIRNDFKKCAEKFSNMKPQLSENSVSTSSNGNNEFII